MTQLTGWAKVAQVSKNLGKPTTQPMTISIARPSDFAPSALSIIKYTSARLRGGSVYDRGCSCFAVRSAARPCLVGSSNGHAGVPSL